jgi:hypothetical protein
MSPLVTVGTVRTSPPVRGESLRRRDGGSTEWWLILDVDPELGRYLRAEYSRARFRTVQLQPPLWGTHVSVVRGEEPPAKAAWKSFDGRRVEVWYGRDVQETGEYAWLPASCPAATAIRVELGLPPEPTPGLHLTFGNTKG